VDVSNRRQTRDPRPAVGTMRRLRQPDAERPNPQRPL
jgi:hypothetical protein